LTFVPSVPPAMMTVTVRKRRALRRLIYKTLPQVAGQASKLPQLVLKFEVELLDLLSASTEATQDLQKFPTHEDMLLSDESDSSADHASSQGVSQSGTLPEALKNGWDTSCQAGRETLVNVMFPDRPMDMQLCIFDWDGVALMQQPQVLREYAEKFCHSSTNKASLSQPDPPSTISYEGRAYYLCDSLSLRQSTNPNLLSTISSDCNTDNLGEVSLESIIDPQSTQKTELCQVKFNGTTDGPGWRRFLTACDQLSVVSLQSRGNDKPQAVYLEK